MLGSMWSPEKKPMDYRRIQIAKAILDAERKSGKAIDSYV